MSDNSKRCADCKHFSIDSYCRHPNPIEAMFKDKDNPRIRHPELTWCVNIEIKTKKESYDKEAKS